MANRTIKIYGNNFAADTALVVSFGGAEVYNGTLSASVVSAADVYSTTSITPVELCTFTFNNSDDTVESSHALSITCNSGSCQIGEIYDSAEDDGTLYNTYPGSDATNGKPPTIVIGGMHYWMPGSGGVYHDNSELNTDGTNSLINRTSITLNGSAPTADANGTAILSAGTTYDGHCFILGDSDVLAMTLRVAKKIVTNPDPDKGAGNGGGHWVNA